MFNEGDKVTWTSDDPGLRKEKNGTVVEVVSAYRYPDRNRFPSLHTRSRSNGIRDHISYVFRSEGANYWPDVKDLNRLELSTKPKTCKFCGYLDLDCECFLR